MKYIVRVQPTEENRHWKLLESFHTPLFIVPEGFVTDGASVPIGLRWRFPHGGRKFAAAVAHDYAYQTGVCNRAQADRLFYKLMIENGVGKHDANLLYWGVKLFGWIVWNKRR